MSDPRPEARIMDAYLLRQLHLELMNEPCEQCELRPGTQLHHIQFKSHSGSDERQNLIWLCPQCHAQQHGL
jgi:5-methylcytosine-specific restriction endonuclease McrA